MTQDMMHKWNNISDLKCPFCKQCPNLHSRLFFQCEFAKKLWWVLKGKLYADMFPDDWTGIISTMVLLNNNNAIRSVSRRTVLVATVYFVWQERNKRIMANEVLIGIILEYVKLKLTSLKVKHSVQVRKFAREWDVIMMGRVQRWLGSSRV